MESTKPNAAALRKRADELVKHFISHYQAILRNAQQDPDQDYSSTALKELKIKEDAMGIVTTAQNTTTFIRDLQELWLFGSLDTLTDPADEEADKARAIEIAQLVEKLAKVPPKAPSSGGEQNGVSNEET